MVEQKGYNWPENFSIGVLQGRSLDAVKQWTPVLAEDTGMKVHLPYTSDTVERYKWLQDGIVDICDGGDMELGRVMAAGFPVRIVWASSKFNSGFMVRGDSYIKDIYDIKSGVRVADTRSYLPTQANTEGLLAWAGIYDLENDVNWVQANNSEEKAQLIVDGKADIAFAYATAPEIYKAEENPHGLRWIELNDKKDPEGARRMNEKYLTIFGPMFIGVPSCIGRWSTVGISMLNCRTDADTEFIYHLVKWLDENWTRYKDLHFWFEHMTLKNVMVELDRTFVPCHDGLIKYLKELGLWTDAHEERHKVNVDLVARYSTANQAAMRLADEKQIVVSPGNPEWVDLWENFKKEQGLPVFDLLPSLGKGKVS